MDSQPSPSPAPTPPPSLSDQLRDAVRRDPRSLRSLAAVSHIDHSQLSRWLRGQRGLTLDALDALAATLRASLIVETINPNAPAPAPATSPDAPAPPTHTPTNSHTQGRPPMADDPARPAPTRTRKKAPTRGGYRPNSGCKPKSAAASDASDAANSAANFAAATHSPNQPANLVTIATRVPPALLDALEAHRRTLEPNPPSRSALVAAILSDALLSPRADTPPDTPPATPDAPPAPPAPPTDTDNQNSWPDL